jgi:CheY-like chemotaxis protein
VTQPLICVIEDYPDSRVLITAVLTKAGMEVVTAGSGSELDVLLSNGREPKLFLIDLSLPGEDGTSILSRLRLDAKFRDTPMIALTAHAMAGDAERGRAAGFDEYITKPVDVATLPALLSGFIRPM